MEVERSDIAKMRDALADAERFFLARDRSNAAVHRSSETRFSPLTTVVQAERERGDRLLENQ